MYIFTSESVSAGHPDKVCDFISDSILDAIIAQDPNARVAVETMAKDNNVILGGEVTTTAEIHYEKIVRDAVKSIGYNTDELGFNGDTLKFFNFIGQQSPDINQGVDRDTEEVQGAGDQGIMFGYATNETPELMPAAICYAHGIMKSLHSYSKQNPRFRPDAKSQVSLRYNDDGSIDSVDTVVVSTQHHEDVSFAEINQVVKRIVAEVIPNEFLTAHTQYLINPTGKFVIGGPVGDAGLTGRKIIVDTYGGAARHGGGAFSGKDPSKVDRSAAYAARWVAKNIVAKKMADRCEIQISYAIGVDKPVSILVETFGTEKITKTEIEKFISENFDLTPYGITKSLDLKRPIYAQTAAYGHFGRNEFPWEQIID